LRGKGLYLQKGGIRLGSKRPSDERRKGNLFRNLIFVYHDFSTMGPPRLLLYLGLTGGDIKERRRGTVS